MTRRFPTLLGGLALLAGAVLLTAQPEAGPLPELGAGAQRAVRVAEVTTEHEVHDLRLRGVTRAARRARLSFLVGGRLAARPVEVGDPVAKGQLLARLDDSEIRNAVAAADARRAEADVRLVQARRDVARVEALAASKAATSEELEVVKSRLEAAEAGAEAASSALDEARRLLGETRLVAPFEARVTEVAGEPGEQVGPGIPLVTLSGEGAVEVEVEAPASIALRLEPGAPARVELPGTDVDVLGGVIRTVGRTASGAGRLFPVVVELPPGAPAVAGLAAEVVVALDRGERISVPVDAVVDPGGRRPSVYRVVEGTVEKVEVRIESLREDRVAVTGDLRAGDRVVVGGQRGLLDGESVEVIP